MQRCLEFGNFEHVLTKNQCVFNMTSLKIIVLDLYCVHEVYNISDLGHFQIFSNGVVQYLFKIIGWKWMACVNVHDWITQNHNGWFDKVEKYTTGKMSGQNVWCVKMKSVVNNVPLLHNKFLRTSVEIV